MNTPVSSRILHLLWSQDSPRGSLSGSAAHLSRSGFLHCQCQSLSACRAGQGSARPWPCTPHRRSPPRLPTSLGAAAAASPGPTAGCALPQSSPSAHPPDSSSPTGIVKSTCMHWCQFLHIALDKARQQPTAYMAFLDKPACPKNTPLHSVLRLLRAAWSAQREEWGQKNSRQGLERVGRWAQRRQAGALAPCRPHFLRKSAAELASAPSKMARCKFGEASEEIEKRDVCRSGPQNPTRQPSGQDGHRAARHKTPPNSQCTYGAPTGVHSRKNGGRRAADRGWRGWAGGRSDGSGG